MALKPAELGVRIVEQPNEPGPLKVRLEAVELDGKPCEVMYCGSFPHRLAAMEHVRRNRYRLV